MNIAKVMKLFIRTDVDRFISGNFYSFRMFHITKSERHLVDLERVKLKLHCLRVPKTECERKNRQRRTERRKDRDMDEQRRTDITGTQEQFSLKL